MAHVFIDGTLSTGSNNGSSTDDAFQLFSTGLSTAKTITEATYFWIRRTTVESYTGNITSNHTGNYQSRPVFYIACPRVALTLTANWTQGEHVITESSIACSLTKHGARLIKNDTDSNYYLIAGVAYKIVLESQTVEFAQYRNVVGATSGAIGKIQKYVNNGDGTAILWVSLRGSTDFSAGEGISSVAGGSATVTSVDVDNGFILHRKYAGTTEENGNSTIKADDFKDVWDTIDDSSWTIKKADWEADADDLPQITLNASTNRLTFGTYYGFLQGLYFVGGGGGGYGGLRATGFGFVLKNCVSKAVFQWGVEIGALTDAHVINCVCIGNVGTAGTDTIKIDCNRARLVSSAFYYGGTYNIHTFQGCFIEDCSVGILGDSTSLDIQVQNGIIIGNDIECGGANGTLRTSSYDDYRCEIRVDNWQRTRGSSIYKTSNGYVKYQTATGATDPVKRTGGSDFVISYTQNESASYLPATDYLYKVLWERPIKFTTTGTKTIRLYIQNNGFGNINTADTFNNRQLWLTALYTKQNVSESLYLFDRENLFLRKCGTSSSNPIGNRSNSSDWTKYLQVSFDLVVAETVVIAVCSRLYNATGIIYIDPEFELV